MPDWLPVVLALLAQTVGIVWWASRVHTKVERHEKRLEQLNGIEKTLASLGDIVVGLRGWQRDEARPTFTKLQISDARLDQRVTALEKEKD